MQGADLLNSPLDSGYFLTEPKLEHSSLNPFMIKSLSAKYVIFTNFKKY